MATIITLLLAATIVAQQPTLPTMSPAQPMGHIQSGELTFLCGDAVLHETWIQVGNLVYASPQIYKEVQMDKDYPVNIKTDKHGVAKKLEVMVGEKKYTYRIRATYEVKPT